MEATGGMSASLPELDLLLTGGRLEAKHAVQAAYHQRNGWKAVEWVENSPELDGFNDFF
jgi:hypothetical protein